MAQNVCVTCRWESESGVTVDLSKPKTEWAKEVGVSEASIRRHLAHSEVSDLSGPKEPPASLSDLVYGGFVDDFLEEQGIPTESVTSRGKSIRLPDGSWEKINWQPNAKALADSLKYDDLREALDGFDGTFQRDPYDFQRRLDHASVLNMADLQIGKANQRGGGTRESLERIRNSVDKFASYIQLAVPFEVVIVDNGDVIENFLNTPQQLVTNDLALPEQIRVARRALLEAIKRLAPLTPKLTFVSIPSNHGQFRTGYKAAGGTVDADFGLEISYQIEDAVRENPTLDHVQFIRPRPLDETAEYETSGTKMAFNHGHQSSGPNSLSKWWAAQAHGRMAGWDADIMVFGHYHSLRVEQSGNGRWLIVCSSSDPGSDWFTNRTGESALAGMTAFDVRDGQWSNLRIV